VRTSTLVRTSTRVGPDGQRGLALVTALLLLIVVTIMALSMFRSYGIQERIAGNTRDKQRAINAAESAQQYAEYWLTSAAAPVAGVCTGVVPSSVGQVCTLPIASPTTLPWVAGVTYTQFTANAINGVSNTVSTTTPTAGSYYAAPLFYITDLGANAGVTGEVYQIDALGYGGTANTVAVVESTYLITTGSAKDPSK
jgi:type IV pilus assembly protein PilX